jgi:sporulation protein YlmC with PRC-barrel domain
MLRSLDSVLGSSILATDGEIGKVYNVLFDDRTWGVRYLVVETGSWLARRKVLLSPAVLGRSDWTEKRIPALLTREQVRNSPDVDADQPVSRQQELAMIRHYSWPDHVGAESPFPHVAWADEPVPEPVVEATGDQHLRSAKEVANYRVDASDGPLGNIADFIIDDDGWGILDLVVNVESPPDDHKVLVPTRWVSGLSWDDLRVQSRHPREDCVTADVLIEAWRD